MLRTYLVERTDKWGYDDYDKFICFASSPEEAKQLDPGGGLYVWKDDCWQMEHSDGSFSKAGKYHSWATPDNVKVWEVDPNRAEKPEVILASYNAG